jgi:hypothetical protein
MHPLLNRLSVLTFACILAACATPGGYAPKTAASNAKFDVQTAQAVQKNFESQGWLFVSSIQTPTNGEGLYFVNPNTVARFGNVARVTSFIAYADRAPQSTISSIQISNQFDCVARTAQLLAVEVFADHYAKMSIVSVREAQKAQPVTVNTMNDVVMVAACSGRLEALGKGQNKAVSSKI